MKKLAVIEEIRPEWYRIPDATRASGIGRSSLYSLIKEGKVKSVCLKNRNSQRGIRLINADSLSAFIESFANGNAIEPVHLSKIHRKSAKSSE